MPDSAPQKILILRLSSIGDIVLTTPIVRSLRKSFPDAEIHYLTKKGYHDLLKFNPYLTKTHLFDKNQGLNPLIDSLKKERFDLVLDLHHNLRTLRIKMALGLPSYSFPKLNKEKFLLTRFKIDRLPDVHIVDRYAEVLAPLGCQLDVEGLDFFCGEKASQGAENVFTGFGQISPIAVVLGGLKATKRWPIAYYAPLLNRLGQPVILFGGPAESADAETVRKDLTVPCFNAAGRYDLLTSAALLRHCGFSIANDTGFMHISAAFGLRVVSLWGNTVPQFGMYPYKTEHLIIEEAGLNCRPCSKIGYPKCPKGHFDCMQKLTPERVYDEISNAGWI